MALHDGKPLDKFVDKRQTFVEKSVKVLETYTNDYYLLILQFV